LYPRAQECFEAQNGLGMLAAVCRLAGSLTNISFVEPNVENSLAWSCLPWCPCSVFPALEGGSGTSHRPLRAAARSCPNQGGKVEFRALPRGQELCSKANQEHSQTVRRELDTLAMAYAEMADRRVLTGPDQKLDLA